MKRSIFITFIIVLMIFNCTNYTKFEAELNVLKDQYNIDQTNNSAFNIADFYNNKYHKTKEQCEEGLKIVEELYNKYPDDPRIEIIYANLFSYLGSCYASKFNYPEAMKYIDKSFSLLDIGAEKYPNNYFVSLVRGINSVSVPNMLGRIDIGLSDLEKLYNMTNLPDDTKILTMYYYSKALKKKKNKQLSDKVMKELKEKFPDYKKEIQEY